MEAKKLSTDERRTGGEGWALSSPQADFSALGHRWKDRVQDNAVTPYEPAELKAVGYQGEAKWPNLKLQGELWA